MVRHVDHKNTFISIAMTIDVQHHEWQLTTVSTAMDFVRRGFQLARDPKQNQWVAPLLYFADGLLCVLIVWKIPYTEIDWKAYMQQIEIYLAGERDYIKIRGDTGPLVYPGAHVHIYRILHALTARGVDIALAQFIFIAVYLAALATVLQCYRAAGAPPYLLPLLILSKRLHSIFLLRLFNDGFAVLFLFVAIYCYQRRLWTLGSASYSLGIGTKMSLLLALPAVGLVLWQGIGRDRALRQAGIMAQLQVLLGYQFLVAAPRSYLTRAFEFSRQFLFKWTVNWRFVGEDVFLSKGFSIGLLAAQALLLLLFVSFRWLQPSQTSVLGALKQLVQPPPSNTQTSVARRTDPRFIMTTTLSAIVLGCLCARSLHYQFYAYIAWSTPFLLWQAGIHPVLIYIIWAAQEWAWNVYPSTDVSSGVVVASLAITTFGVLVGGNGIPEDIKKPHEHQE